MLLCALPHEYVNATDLLADADASSLLVAAGTTFGTVPGVIQAEDFDSGAAGIAYSDKDATNRGGMYRDTGVDIKTTADTGGGYVVGWTAAGEWLKYSLTVATTGTYKLDVRVASAVAGGQFKLYVDGVDKSGTLTVPNTGGYESYATISKDGIALTAGSHEFELRMTANNPQGAVGNFNWFQLTQQGTTPTTPSPTVRVEVGATVGFTDNAGVYWSPDAQYASGGTAKSDTFAVDGTTNDALYATRRFGNFSYNVPVVVGTYTLSLYFTDPVFTTGGKRTFDAFAEGRQLLNDYDIAAEAGAKFAVLKTFSVTVNDGTFNLNFVSVKDNAILSAFSLVPQSTTPPTEPPPPTITPSAPFTWQPAANNPVARYESQGIAASGKLYVFGGFYDIDAQKISRTTLQSHAFDPASNTWTRIADVPEPLTHAGMAVDGDTIWFAGGFLGDNPGPSTNHVWKYSISQNRFTAGPSLPAVRTGGALVIVGRALHYISGGVRLGTEWITYDSPDHWTYDLSKNDGWKNAPAITNPRNHMAGVAIGTKIYVMGGQHLQDEVSGNQSQVDIYDTVAKTWSRGRDIPIELGHVQSSIAVRAGRIVVAGGLTTGRQTVSNVFEYDPVTNSWTALLSLPEGRQSPIIGYINGKLVVSTGLKADFNTSGTTWVGSIADRWEAGVSVPKSLGEVAVGVIGDRIVVVGEGNNGTFVYDPTLGEWTTNYRPVRPYVGHHHAAEVIGSRLYLFGGIGGGSEGKVQFFDLTTNTWGTGTSMPFAAASSSSAVINGLVYVAGGIVGNTTTNRVAVYNPTTNRWTELATMPVGVNHAANATDGKRLFVFGGRTGGNMVGNGFNYTQIYDPATNKWTSSATSSSIAPLPQARGGTGKAVYYQGEFFILGGETLTGAGATSAGVYARVDVYNPTTNGWRRAADMPTARHGIFPVLRNGRLYVFGGGIKAGFSQSAITQILNLD